MPARHCSEVKGLIYAIHEYETERTTRPRDIDTNTMTYEVYTSTHSDTLNTELLNSYNHPLYTIKTEYNLSMPDTTVISKLLLSGREETLAEITWQWLARNKGILRFRGKTMSMKEFIHRVRPFTRCGFDALVRLIPKA
jgi:hypothetical protein